MTAAKTGCERFEYTNRWGSQVTFPLTPELRDALDHRDRELELWLDICRCRCGPGTCGPFEYTTRWTDLPDVLTAPALAVLEEHDRELEKYLHDCFCVCEGSSATHPPFEYTNRWPQIADPDAARMLNDRDFELERYLSHTDCDCSGRHWLTRGYEGIDLSETSGLTDLSFSEPDLVAAVTDVGRYVGGKWWTTWHHTGGTPPNGWATRDQLDTGGWTRADVVSWPIDESTSLLFDYIGVNVFGEASGGNFMVPSVNFDVPAYEVNWAQTDGSGGWTQAQISFVDFPDLQGVLCTMRGPIWVLWAKTNDGTDHSWFNISTDHGASWGGWTSDGDLAAPLLPFSPDLIYDLAAYNPVHDVYVYPYADDSTIKAVVSAVGDPTSLTAVVIDAGASGVVDNIVIDPNNGAMVAFTSAALSETAAGSGAYYSTDAGATWAPCDFGATIVAVNNDRRLGFQIDFNQPRNKVAVAVAVTDIANIYTSTDLSTGTWTLARAAAPAGGSAEVGELVGDDQDTP